MPKISIIMPVYNSAKYLIEAINSILQQTFTDWEFLIINEFGSEDGSKDIIERYVETDNRIILIQNEKRLGISASLNVGIDMAKGEYIARMDADDISMPARFEKQLKYLEENKDIALCGIKPEIFGEESWEWEAENNPEQVYSDSLFFQPALHPTFLIRADILKKYNIRYNEQYNCAEDFDFCVKLLEHGKISNILDKSLFKYRRYPTAATYINQQRGNEICKEIMVKFFFNNELNFTTDEINILYLHNRYDIFNDEDIEKNFIKLDLLLKKILEFNMVNSKYSMKCLALTLNKRWEFEYNVNICSHYGSIVNIPKRIVEIFERSIFFNKCFYKEYKGKTNDKPFVSVVMPCYNGEKYLYESIYSIQNQTFEEWELIIVNDGSKDNSTKIINEYMKHDRRIRLINNKENLKISRTLNRGIENSKGKYIARMDDDDISLPIRLEKQVKFLEENKDISLVGTFQKHFGSYDWIHKPPFSPDDMKASLLFTCEVCHSTIMFRKADFVDNNLFYDPNMLSEDYELWTRAIHKLKFATLQEVLGEYRLNGENITAGKALSFNLEAEKIVANTLKKYLNINVKEQDLVLLSCWLNPFQDENNLNRKELLEKEYKLLNLIGEKNKEYKVYNQKSLEKILSKRKAWAEGIELPVNDDSNINIEEQENGNINIKRKIKKIIKFILKPFYLPFKHRIFDRLQEIQQSVYDSDGHMKDMKKELLDVIYAQQKQINKLSEIIADKQIEEKLDKSICNLEKNMNMLKKINVQIDEAEENMIKVFETQYSKTMETQTNDSSKSI